MGITKADCNFLFYAKKHNVNFEKTCMLVRLILYASHQDLETCIEKYQNAEKNITDVEFKDAYSEPLFEILGAKSIESIDYSDYESATHIHDLNVPIPASFYNKYSCIIDSGTLEHVFNFPVAIKSCMKAIRTGGHYIGITPINNQMGHGFYQFSPELYYRVFSEENGFRVVKMLVAVSVDDNPSWYEVSDPKTVQNRVMVVNNLPLMLMFIAEKTADKEIFSSTPQQSDYVTAWNSFSSIKTGNAEMMGSKFKYLYKKFLPYRVKVILRNLVDIYKKEKVDSPDLGVINPEYFRKTEI